MLSVKIKITMLSKLSQVLQHVFILKKHLHILLYLINLKHIFGGLVFRYLSRSRASVTLEQFLMNHMRLDFYSFKFQGRRSNRKINYNVLLISIEELLCSVIEQWPSELFWNHLLVSDNFPILSYLVKKQNKIMQDWSSCLL